MKDKKAIASRKQIFEEIEKSLLEFYTIKFFYYRHENRENKIIPSFDLDRIQISVLGDLGLMRKSLLQKKVQDNIDFHENLVSKSHIFMDEDYPYIENMYNLNKALVRNIKLYTMI